MKYTDRYIKSLKATGVRYEVWQGDGFGLRVSHIGTKSWIFVYHYQGRPRRITFGKYPAVSVADAHAAHGKALSDLQREIDPGARLVNKNKANRDALTVKDLMFEYMDKWAKPRKRSWREDERILMRNVIPFIGNLRAKEVKKRDIINLLDRVLERGASIAANRTLAVVRRMFNFAVERDVIEMTPCYGIKAPTKESRRDRLLSADEVKKFWELLQTANMSEPLKIALKLQLVTAQRKGEVIASEWEEFDLKQKHWVIPAHKSKNGNAHLVPLSDLALQLLQELKPFSGNSLWLFPSPRGASHIGATAVDHALRKNISKFESVKPFTPHDLRRTAASHMTSAGIPRLVVSKILNHVESSVTAIYDRHTYEKEKREALHVWANKLSEALSEI